VPTANLDTAPVDRCNVQVSIRQANVKGALQSLDAAQERELDSGEGQDDEATVAIVRYDHVFLTPHNPKVVPRPKRAEKTILLSDER
jgi:hypothetical protein